MKIIDISSKERWKVVFEDPGRWRIGLYKPEFKSLEEISYLEKHDRPELFLLLDGRMVLVVQQGGSDKIQEVELRRGRLYIVEEWHNGYRPGGCEGIALVVEAHDTKTIYKDVIFKQARQFGTRRYSA